MSESKFITWLESELKIKEEEDMAKKKKLEVPIITDTQLKLVNQVKTLISDIQDSGVDHITYADISKLDDTYDAVVEESNLMHQGMTVEYGENKGDIIRAYYKDLVRADDADAWEGNADD
jgi:hypothetical protein|tara:strand:+ start:876 stop:1235 length:360 start_codon:yes stop_codon:yes gene_type:complete